MADWYRLYLLLRYARKPIVTGTFAIESFAIMHELLVAVAGSAEALAAKPRAVFDVCPSPPLLWSDITCANLIDCARTGVPAELVSMPLMGATGPQTVVGSAVQHAAECLSGITIHQLAKPGSPIVWGGSPASFDMRTGTTPMGSIATMMLDCTYAQIGKSIKPGGLPTHAYLGMADTKIVDAQTGLESASGAILGALAGVNMMSGPGMMDFESCFSLEKLVIDAEIVGMAKRLVAGVDDSEEPLALTVMREVGHAGNFLKSKHTRRNFRKEDYIPTRGHRPRLSPDLVRQGRAGHQRPRPSQGPGADRRLRAAAAGRRDRQGTGVHCHAPRQGDRRPGQAARTRIASLADLTIRRRRRTIMSEELFKKHGPSRSSTATTKRRRPWRSRRWTPASRRWTRSTRALRPAWTPSASCTPRGEYFLPDLILGGEAMKAALAVLEPALHAAGQEREVLGKLVLGTVKGDIHEIGKSLVGTMLVRQRLRGL